MVRNTQRKKLNKMAGCRRNEWMQNKRAASDSCAGRGTCRAQANARSYEQRIVHRRRIREERDAATENKERVELRCDGETHLGADASDDLIGERGRCRKGKVERRESKIALFSRRRQVALAGHVATEEAKEGGRQDDRLHEILATRGRGRLHCSVPLREFE